MVLIDPLSYIKLNKLFSRKVPLVIEILLPLFLLVAMGWLLSGLSWFSARLSEGASELTANILLPSLLFYGTYQHGLPDDVPLSLLAAFYIPMLMLFTVMLWWRRQQANRSAFALAGIYSNNVFLGLPIISHVVGDSGLSYAYMIIAFHSSLAFSLYYFSSSRQNQVSRWHAIIKTFKNPIVMSLVLGMLLNFSGLQLPAPGISVLNILSEAALPCALFVLGASLSRFRLVDYRQGVAIAAIKLIGLPLLILLMARGVIGLSEPAILVLIILSACPVGISAHPVVVGDGRDGSVVSSAIVLSSIASMVTIPVWLAII